MDCVRCGFSVIKPRQPGIHDLCLTAWEKFHDNLLFSVFPSIFSGKELNRAQGLAIECKRCHRLAVPKDIWDKLPLPLTYEILIYDTTSRQPLCIKCLRIYHRKSGRPPAYRRNADTQLRQAERNFQQEPTRSKWVVWLREAARTGTYPFTPEGVMVATGGSILSFQMTEDGFEAVVDGAEFPAFEIEHHWRTGPDDFESISVPRGTYTGKVIVRWHPSYDDDPGLYIEIPTTQEEELVRMPYLDSEVGDFTRLNTITGADYLFTGGSVQNDAQLHAACHDPKNWDSC